MNLYLVVSEQLEDGRSIFQDPPVPPEPYRIACLVAATNSNQAKYLTWKDDDPSPVQRDMRDMPSFNCELKLKGVNLSKGVLEGNQGESFLESISENEIEYHFLITWCWTFREEILNLPNEKT